MGSVAAKNPPEQTPQRIDTHEAVVTVRESFADDLRRWWLELLFPLRRRRLLQRGVGVRGVPPVPSRHVPVKH